MGRKAVTPLWAMVDEAVARGQAPLVTLPATARIITPKRPPGRPRTNDPNRPKGYNYPLHTHSGTRMRCRATGCPKTLPKSAKGITCSAQCENALRLELTTLLAVLDGKLPAVELPIYLRGGRNKVRAA